MEEQTPHPSFGEAFKFWFKLGFISFGGPTGQISIMHQELVEKKKWVSNDRFLNALNYCMLLPGPEAHQLSIYIGWLLHKNLGGVVAGTFFVLPSIAILFGLSFIYITSGNIPWIAAVFSGLKPAVTAVVAAAVINIGKKALKNEIMVALAVLAFVAIFFFKIPFPLIVLGAGLIGLAGGLLLPNKFIVIKGKEGAREESYVQVCEDPLTCHTNPSATRTVYLILAFLFLWAIPFLSLFLIRSTPVFVTEGFFFTKAAFLTFGGAYSVLAYIAQAGVEQFKWLTAPQMLDGLGLAETTPGPLIMVVQFIGFMAGWNQSGYFSPFWGGLIGSLVATYFTFLPSFFFILLGGPYIEKFSGNKKISSSLSAVTASVVGVVLNLAVWFGLQVLFPASKEVNGFGIFVGSISFVSMQWGNISIIPVILAAGGMGLIWNYLVS